MSETRITSRSANGYITITLPSGATVSLPIADALAVYGQLRLHLVSAGVINPT